MGAKKRKQHICIIEIDSQIQGENQVTKGEKEAERAL